MAATSMRLRGALMQFGTVVGAGTFALPAAFRTSGIVAGSIAFWAMALAILGLHLLYAEIVLARRDLTQARFPGQATRILGPWAGRVAYIIYPAKLIGVSMAYLILGGGFLSALAGHVGVHASTGLWQSLFWLGGVLTLAFGLSLMSRIESWLARILIALIVVCISVFGRHADGALFLPMAWPAWTTLPFGTFIFAMSGWTIIPEVSDVLKHDAYKTRIAVAIGSLVAALSMWLFGVFAYAAIGKGDLGPVGLASAFPAGWTWLVPAVGFIAVASCFVSVSESFRAMLRYDLGWSSLVSRVVSLTVPFAILFLTSGNFLQVVDFIGSYLSTANAILVCAMAWVVLRHLERRVQPWKLAMPWICGAIFLAVLSEHVLMR